MLVQLLLLVSFPNIIFGVLGYLPAVYYKRSQYYYPSYDQFCCWNYYNPWQIYAPQPFLQPLVPPMYPSFTYSSNPPMLSQPKLPSRNVQQHSPAYPMLLPFPYPFGVPQIQPVRQTSTAIILPKPFPTTSKPTPQSTLTTRLNTPPAATIPTITSTTARTTTTPLFNFGFGTISPDPDDDTTIPPTISSKTNTNRNTEYGAPIDNDVEVEGSGGVIDMDDEE